MYVIFIILLIYLMQLEWVIFLHGVLHEGLDGGSEYVMLMYNKTIVPYSNIITLNPILLL